MWALVARLVNVKNNHVLFVIIRMLLNLWRNRFYLHHSFDNIVSKEIGYRKQLSNLASLSLSVNKGVSYRI